MGEKLTKAQVRKVCDGMRDSDGLYRYSEAAPFRDFNREIYPPGTHTTYPDGVVGIRVDDDFWIVASLPYSLIDTPLPTIVAALWPKIKNPRFNPDTELDAEDFARAALKDSPNVR